MTSQLEKFRGQRQSKGWRGVKIIKIKIVNYSWLLWFKITQNQSSSQILETRQILGAWKLNSSIFLN